VNELIAFGILLSYFPRKLTGLGFYTEHCHYGIVSENFGSPHSIRTTITTHGKDSTAGSTVKPKL